MPHFAIGGLHGYLDPLNQLLEFIPAGDTDTLVFPGDYVDGGPDVKGVLDRLIEIQNSRRAVFLRGNHDQIMLDARAGRVSMEVWEGMAGEEGLRSYGAGGACRPLRRSAGAGRAVVGWACARASFMRGRHPG